MRNELVHTDNLNQMYHTSVCKYTLYELTKVCASNNFQNPACWFVCMIRAKRSKYCITVFASYHTIGHNFRLL